MAILSRRSPKIGIIILSLFVWSSLLYAFEENDPFTIGRMTIAAGEMKSGKEMVLAFGIKHIIIDRFRPKDLTHSKYLGNTAVLHGKPAITSESGYLGRTDEEAVRRNVRGIFSVMRLFKLVEGKPLYEVGEVKGE